MFVNVKQEQDVNPWAFVTSFCSNTEGGLKGRRTRGGGVRRLLTVD